MKVFNLKIQFEQDASKILDLQIAENESVLDVCMEHNISLQHNCGGVCGCSTCHIYVNEGMENLQEISEKEEDFIDRAESPKINSRLACQCVAKKGDIVVTIPDQTHFLGH